VTKQTKTCITVHSGKYFDILDPVSFEYEIEDIATALSNLCRYTGHVDHFYSVAEHSVLVSQLVPPKLALCGLLHDASEAFLGDISSPLKQLLPNYKDIENNVQEQIAKAFNLPWPFPEDIHVADKKLYWAERKTLAPGVDSLWHQERGPARKVEVKGFLPKEARKMFINRYKEITNDKARYSFLQPQGSTTNSKAEPHSTRLAAA